MAIAWVYRLSGHPENTRIAAARWAVEMMHVMMALEGGGHGPKLHSMADGVNCGLGGDLSGEWRAGPSERGFNG